MAKKGKKSNKRQKINKKISRQKNKAKRTIKRVNKKIEKARSIGRKIIQGRISKPITKAQQKPQKAQKRKPQKIEGVFRKSTKRIVINDILPMRTNEINLQYKRLFKDIIKDEQMMEIMINQENIKKLSWRMEIRANVYDIKGEKIMTMIKGREGDLMSFREAMNKGLWKGASVEYDIDLGEGYNFKMIKKGNVDRVETIVVFRS